METALGPHCAVCMYAFALQLIIPFDSGPWKFTDELRVEFHKYEGLRLMAPFVGKARVQPRYLDRLR